MAMKDSTMVLLVMGAILVGVVWFLTQQPGAPVVQPGVTPTTCSSETAPEVTFRTYDKYDPAASNDGNFSVRKVGEQTWTTVASGSSLTFAPGDKIEVLADKDFSTGYAKYTPSWEVPCKAAATFEVATADKYTSGLAATFWNSQGTAGTAQPIAAGDTKNVKFQFTGTYKKEYGNSEIGYNIMNCQANSTQIKKLTITGLETAAKPSIISTVSGMDDYTYKFPVLASNTDTNIYTVTVEASATVDPTSDIVCTLYDTNYYIDSLTNIVGKDVQDNDKVNLGVDEGSVAATATILLS